MRTVYIPEDLSSYIESLDYSTNAIRTLLVDAAERNLQDNPVFQRWEKKYEEMHSAFCIAKNELESKYVKPLIVDGQNVEWHLDYTTCIVTIKGGK